jgi:hypothetical protein
MPLKEEKTTPVEENAATRAKRLIELVHVRVKEESMQRAVSQALLYWLRLEAEKTA